LNTPFSSKQTWPSRIKGAGDQSSRLSCQKQHGVHIEKPKFSKKPKYKHRDSRVS